MSQALRPSMRSAQSSWICRACKQRLQAGARNTRWSSTETAPPALLTKMKGDLKTAMRAKDTSRLNVLRGIISEINNASKTSSPITNDLQILSLLKKRKASSHAAQDEARSQNRPDLADKQQAEIGVLDEYAGSVKMMESDEVMHLVGQVVQKMKNNVNETGGEVLKSGLVLKEIFRPGGVLDGKMVEKSQVAKVVADLLK